MIPRCSACPCIPTRQPVPPSGPSPCRIVFIAEAPAKNEDAQLIGLCGQTGQEFNDHYLSLASLFRDQVHVTNAMLCSHQSYRNPKPDEALACSSRHLPPLLSRVQPQIIVTMGAIAASLFPGISLPLHHGIPQPAQFGDWSGILLPTHHPSAGMHSTSYMIPLRQDFMALKLLIKSLDDGSFSWPTDPHPNPDYRVIHTVHDLSAYLTHHYYSIGTDTETLPTPTHDPYCLTLSHTPGTGRLIYADNLPVLNAYASYLRYFRPMLEFHNYLFDCEPYNKMGLPILPGRFSDTMVRAYELGIGGGGDEDDSGGRGSLGLKTLAYRHLHMHMSSFKDTVTPYTIPHVLDWLLQAESLTSPIESAPQCQCGHPREFHSPRGKTGRLMGACTGNALCWCWCLKWTPIKPPKADKSMGLLNRRIKNLTSALFSGDPNCDPWKRMDPSDKESDGGWQVWEIDMLTDLIGKPCPVRDISLVPEDVLVNYACKDSDATRRLSQFLNTYRIQS